MIVTIALEWLLRIVLFFVNSWLFVSIYRSKEVNTIFIFVMLYFIILNDCLAFFVYTIHDIPSFFVGESIFIYYPVLYNLSTGILAVQWFFHLFFLPLFSLIHFVALFFPFVFRHIRKEIFYGFVLVLYILTAAVTVPLFTSCCGFVYNAEFHFWFFDFTKPYTDVYQAGNNYLQIFCISIMAFANVVIIVRLFRLRKRSTSMSKTSVIAVSTVSSQRGQVGPPRRKISLNMPPEVRLAISFVLLSFCFFISTVSFNLLTGTRSTLLMLVNLICGYLNFSKWIIYSLGNRNIRRAFLSPFR